MDHSRIIDALGGNVGLAEILGAEPGNVSRWRRRGIPARYWPRVLVAAKRRRLGWITLDALEARLAADERAAA